jgi:hypothetical protein
MKRAAWVVVAMLCLATMMFAKEPKDKQKGMEITGTVCNSKCVVQQNNLSTCDRGCNDKSGDVVLVDDSGKVMKVENPKMAMPHMGKHVKAMCVPSEKEREETVRILEIQKLAP